jgi:sterol desaturase/sphingolipid hydroxylase (fatty acid hydroxylase superfamily)
MINVANGLLLFGLKLAVIDGIVGYLSVGLIDTSALGEPWQQFVVAFLVLDFARYWLHRIHHRVPFLWTFHRVHHMTERLDATAGLRMHIVDFVQLTLLPSILFGLLIDTTAWAEWVLVGVLSVGVVFDAFQHANLRWNCAHPIARVWGWVFNHPHFHAWHHVREAARCDGNYGNTLVVWDRIFGSEVTGEALPDALGLVPSQALRNDLLSMQLLRRHS